MLRLRYSRTSESMPRTSPLFHIWRNVEREIAKLDLLPAMRNIDLGWCTHLRVGWEKPSRNRDAESKCKSPDRKAKDYRRITLFLLPPNAVPENCRVHLWEPSNACTSAAGRTTAPFIISAASCPLRGPLIPVRCKRYAAARVKQRSVIKRKK